MVTKQKERPVTYQGLRVLGDCVLVRDFVTADKTKGGVLIPETARRKSQYAQVVGVGDGVTANIKLGDIVAYPAYVGLEMSVVSDQGREEKLLLMDVKNVKAIYTHGVPKVQDGYDGIEEAARIFSNERG